MSRAVVDATAPPPNPAATVALVAGLLSWLPGVGVVAVLAGLIAGQRARATGGSGRGRAFAGMILGVGSLLLWAMIVGAVFQGRAMMRAAPAVKATGQFVMLVGSGQVSAAKGMCTDAIDLDRLTETAGQFQALGTFREPPKPAGGKPLGDGVQVDYSLPFEKATKLISADWVFIDGQPRLADYRLVENPATQP